MGKIGMRNIKTALSVFICIIILRLFGFKYPFYACIASVICIQNSISGSFKTGKNRMIGTMIGATIGFIFSLIHLDSAFLCFIGIICVIYCCNITKVKESSTIACIVFLAITTNLKDVTPFMYSVYRIFETFIGITVAVILNYLLNPPNYFSKVNNISKDIHRKIFSVCNLLVEGQNINTNEIDKKIHELKNYINLYNKEIKYIRKEEKDSYKLSNLINLYEKVYLHLTIISSLDNKKLSCKNFNELTKILEIKEDYYEMDYDKCANDTNSVFNHHLEEVIILVKEVQEVLL
ncbi:FUSC family protein [Clostridium sp. ZS2-4]|uniref:FUSC family protein n=1 Tax=Clostridium sp. ZS2-4 TaxID=2987703 RepID=UPI00227BCA61|nr:aromatic acid exporter family protein [Clostridium sp. ZS2-4]MCY6356679.1 aromatic acid exporter family protein [Clostridium sp. ZS2-4]